MTRWWAVVPVKDARRGKSRLAPVLDDDARADLVRRMAVATVEALVASRRVAHVVLVTPDDVLGERLRGPAVTVLDEPGPPRAGSGTGLDAAALAGAAHARTADPTASVVVVLGDLPYLTPADVDDVLAAAARTQRAHVPDAPGTGTTMLTATWPHELRPAFGPGSSARHTAAGHVRLDVAATSSARQDVDEPADLAALAPGGTPWPTARRRVTSG